MKYDWKDSQAIENFSDSLGGVFTISDLANLLAEGQRAVLYRRIGRMEKLGVLSRFSRGVYVTKGYRPQVLSQKLALESYVSFGWVLARALIIGSQPEHQLDAVKLGRKRIYTGQGFRVRHLGCSQGVFFGYETEGGLNTATPEKAFLDTLYFCQHGVEFHFDIYSDLNLDLLDQKRVGDMLVRYKNPKFVSFVEGMFS